jgi:hypothetical protein
VVCLCVSLCVLVCAFLSMLRVHRWQRKCGARYWHCTTNRILLRRVFFFSILLMFALFFHLLLSFFLYLGLLVVHSIPYYIRTRNTSNGVLFTIHAYRKHSHKKYNIYNLNLILRPFIVLNNNKNVIPVDHTD